MILTRRAYLWLLVGIPLAFGLARINTVTLGLTVLGLWDLGILGLVICESWESQRRRAVVQRVPLGRLSIGRENCVQIQIQSGDFAAVLQIRDTVPLGLVAAVDTLTASLAIHTQSQLVYTVTPTRRGVYEWGSLAIRQLSPWGLCWDQWQVSASEKVAVYPDLIGLQELRLQLALTSTGSQRQPRSFALGTEFRELRDYRRGDDLRLVHWPATARHHSPLVRVMEPEQEQTILILLDRGRLMTASLQGLQRFDWALNALLALAQTALTCGDKVGVGVFDRTLTTWLPPQRGLSHLSVLIERLTPLNPDWLEPDYMEAVSTLWRYHNRRALVVMLTDVMDLTASSELLTAMRRLTPRYLPLCVALRDPLLDDYAAYAPVPLDQGSHSAYTRAVALDLLNQRHIALAHAQRQGALILDAAPSQLQQSLVNQYLRLKTRQQL